MIPSAVHALLAQVGPLQCLMQEGYPHAVGGGHQQESFECFTGA
ncbi:hypothetical protein [Streptomyces sp. NBC_00988]